MDDLVARWDAMCERMRLQEYRKTHDRVRVIVTMMSLPDPDEPADSFYVQVKASGRLREIMRKYQSEYPEWNDCFEDAPINFVPQHGPQLHISESALEAVTGYWGCDDWRDKEVDYVGCVEWALYDFIHTLTGFYAKVEWAAAE